MPQLSDGKYTFGEYLVDAIMMNGLCYAELAHKMPARVRKDLKDAGVPNKGPCIFWYGHAEEQLESYVMKYIEQKGSKELADEVRRVIIDE